MRSEQTPLMPHQRQHWGVEPEPAPPSRPVIGEPRSPEESRREAKRLLWRDSAIVMVWILLAALVLNYLPAIAPGLLASETDVPSGGGAGASRAPGSSLPPGATLGPVVDPGRGVDATQRPVPGLTLPPTGSFVPVEPGAPTPSPRPTKKPPASIAPPTQPPSPTPTPVVTPPPTEPPPTEPPPTDPPTDPPPSDAP